MKGKRARSFRRISSMSTLHPSTDQHDPDSAGQQALPAAFGNTISLGMGMGMDMVMGMLDGARVPPHKWKRGVPDASPSLPAAPSFLEVCFSCNRTLGHGRDIYIYRGDTAFCSEECRQHQIAMDEHRERFLTPPQAIAAVNK